MDHNKSRTNDRIQHPFSRNWLRFVSFVLILLIAIAGHFYYRSEIRHRRLDVQMDLQTVAELKAGDMSQWVKERKADVGALANNPLFIRELQATLENKSLESKELLEETFKILEKAYDYQEIFILQNTERVLLSSGSSPNIDAELLPILKTIAWQTNEVFQKLYLCKNHQEIHLDFIYPLLVEQDSLFLIFRIDPQRTFYPRIQTWPTSSKTAETLIVKKDGNQALFLNELRYQKNTALHLRIPETQTMVPAVQAILGFEGIYSGLDYRNKKVIADIRQIRGTPWYLITKIDKREAYDEVVFRAVSIGVITVILIVAGLFGLFWLYDRSQRNLYRNLFDKERQLLESQESFRAILYSIGDAVITTDASGALLQLNPMAEKLTGWKVDAAAGKSLYDICKLVSESTSALVNSPIDAALKLGKTVGTSSETLLWTTDGRKVPVSSRAAPIRDDLNHITGVVLVLRDQSMERQAQMMINESQEQFRRLFDSSNEGMALHELLRNEEGTIQDYRILRVNKKYEEFLTINRGQAEGEMASKLYGRPLYLDIYQRVVQSGNPEVFEVYYKPTDKHFIVSAFTPGPNQFAAVFQDISQRKRLMTELEMAKKEAEDASNLKTRILANMSHEIRTPLNGILGFAEILKDDLKDEANSQMAAIIYSSGSRLLSTLNGIIDLSLAESGGKGINLRRVNVDQIVQETINLFSKNAEKRRLKLSYRPSDPGLDILADSDLATKVLNNLINNAIKFTKEGSIEVAVYEEKFEHQAMVCIAVKDTGIGIKSDNLQIIFEEFRQASEGNTRSYDGAGLGLHISRRFAALMKGNITVESEWGKGSVFMLWLPLYSQA